MSLNRIFIVTFNKKCAILMHWKLKKKKKLPKEKNEDLEKLVYRCQFSLSNHTCGINYNLILKSTWNGKPKIILKKKNIVMELILSYFKSYNKATVIKTL